MLFTVGGLFAIYEGIDKIRHPHELESPPGSRSLVLSIAIVLETFSLRTAVQGVGPRARRQALVQFVPHAKAPELPVVLLEDIAAPCSASSVALFGVGLTVITGNDRCSTLWARS